MELRLPQEPGWDAALRYLGYRAGEAPDAATGALLERACTVLRAAARPRAVWLWLPRTEMEPILQGQDILRHLAGCEAGVLLGCTLGAGVDARVRGAQAADMAFAVVLDALASVWADAAAKETEALIRAEAQQRGLFVTGRFSPGYGDWPIEVQNTVVRLLDAPRKIGLSATSTHLLTPRKSVTALAGAAAHPVTGRRAGCAACAMRGRCAYRKEGKTCESDI